MHRGNLSVHKAQQFKLVVVHDRAVLQMHSAIFSMGSAISEAYLNLKHNAMPPFPQTSQTIQLLHTSFA